MEWNTDDVEPSSATRVTRVQTGNGQTQQRYELAQYVTDTQRGWQLTRYLEWHQQLERSRTLLAGHITSGCSACQLLPGSAVVSLPA